MVLTRVLADHRAPAHAAGHVAVGWLVVEDLYTVLVLVLLPILPARGRRGRRAGPGRRAGVVKIAAPLPSPSGRRTVIHSDRRPGPGPELFTLTVLVLVWDCRRSAELFGASMALGRSWPAIVGRSDFSLRAASDPLPIRDAFAVLFFVSIGCSWTRHLVNSPVQVAALAFAVLGNRWPP